MKLNGINVQGYIEKGGGVIVMFDDGTELMRMVDLKYN